ncbi:uncharacterized protein BDV17DRAFT_289263 [Aspergillus undulatus]|uniref:uncharacterized protein n=1 Tax=Aspergillus undulatus TaxID=1810928 RepID=UPI003CCCBFAD
MDSTFSPSPAQFALALAIVKSKPAGRDLKEYILQIRASITASKSAEISHSPDKFFDSVAFWKQAYEKSEAEQSKLHDRIFELEQRNEELKTKLHLQEDLKAESATRKDASAVKEPLKRAASSGNTSRKRPKTQLSRDEDIRAFRDDVLDRLNDAGESPSPFIRQSYTLRKTLQRRPDYARITRDAATLCKTCENELISAIPENYSKGKSTKVTPTESQISHLGLVVHCVGSAMSLLLQALKRLSMTGGSVKEARVLIYHIVCLYEVSLTSLKKYCKAVSVPVPPAAPAAPIRAEYDMQTRSKTSKQTESRNESNSQIELNRDEGAFKLTSLLNRMLTMLDLSCPGHRQLLEGFIYILLSRAGKTLCLFVFQDLKLQPHLQMDPDALPTPAGLVDAELDDKSRGGAQMDAIYLLWLLRRALVALNTQPSSSDLAVPESQFLSSIKTRLQSTLVQAVFGPDPELGRTLERPAQPEGNIESLIEGQRMSGSTIPDWYIREVWDLVGWEVLNNNN